MSDGGDSPDFLRNGKGFSINDSSSKSVPLLDTSYSSLEASVASSSSLAPAGFSYISTDMTAEAIRDCEKFILTPYSHALKIIGWLPYRNTLGGYIWQSILVTIWFVCIASTMVTQILSCFKRDAFVPGKTISETTSSPSTTRSPLDLVGRDVGVLSLLSSMNETTGAPLEPSEKIIRCEEHIISSLILLDFVVLATYLYGVYLFVRGETDYLFGLASHVFIKNAEAESSSKRLIGTIGVLFLLGIAWLLFSLTVRVMTAVSVELFEKDVSIMWGDSLSLMDAVKISLLIFSLFGFFTFDTVYMFSIMNYVVQAEMNIYLLWDVRRLMEIKKYDHIDGGIKDTQKCKQYLDILNGKTATLTSLSLFVLCNLGMTAIIDLDNVDETKLLISDPFRYLASVSAFLNVVCWCSLISLPFVQAARVTYWCEQLKDLGPQIRGRVQVGYANTSLLELDSLLSFLQNIKLRASIFGFPITPWLLYLVVVAFSFTMLVLFQIDSYSVTKYI